MKHIMDKNKLFQKLFNMYKSIYPYKKVGEMQIKAFEFWNFIKLESSFQELYHLKLQEL